MNLCLNMIVKNEAARITRCLDSVAQFIDCFVITDTGSTDDTPKVIKEYFAQQRIPGHVTHAPFRDWSQARNAALIAARSCQDRFKWDYAILMDADMALVMKDLAKFKAALTSPLSYDMEQRGGTVHYLNRRVISAHARGLYRGVTHEYLDVHSAGTIGPEIAYFDDHADGANRPQKYKRDIELLLGGLQAEPNNERYFYYLAQSYRDAGETDLAMHWYRKRVAAGGWPEEQWSAQVNLASCFKDKGDEDGFVREMLIAYNMRPSRAETMYDLAHHFRMKDGKQNIAAAFAEIGMAIPRTTDGLFVNNFVYESGLKEEFAITGFYNDQKRTKAFAVCDKLSMQTGPYDGPRQTARQNMFFYLPKMVDIAPTWVSKRIPFTPPENWTAMNPSITNHGVDDRCYCNVRCVNYRIDEHGRYLIRGTDGTANAENPINTRNFILDMGYDPMSDTAPGVTELRPPPCMPCEFPQVIGFEDVRLFSARGELCSSATVRQIHWDGNCEQVLCRIERGNDQMCDMRRMLPAKRETEKNWAPIGARPDDNRQLLFMWRPGTTVNHRGEVVHNNPPAGMTTDIISGGSQLIGLAHGYVALVHTAQQLPGSPCRYYYHRFAFYDAATFKLVNLSMPFVFEDKQIEFAAGIARHPSQKGVYVISYGSRDAEARVGTITEGDIMRLLWQPKS